MKFEPGDIATKVVNSYRRDIMSYLGLRYYFSNSAAIEDNWANGICVRRALRSSNHQYYRSLHYKERNKESNTPVYRVLHYPTPNNMIAEAALLAACSEAGGAFQSHTSCYSYRLIDRDDRRGIFLPYFIGFRSRHNDIAEHARQRKGSYVLYTDIRKFYPSIQLNDASSVWDKSSHSSGLDSWAYKLGHKLIESHTSVDDGGHKAILTGPMLSHLIANLVMAGIDQRLSDILPGGYFRYVDDIALVGNKSEVIEAEKVLVDLLSKLDLALHPGKRMLVSSSEWLDGANDFNDERQGVSWMTFIGQLKQYCLARPDDKTNLFEKLKALGIRLSPLSYESQIHEQKFLARFRDLIAKRWFRKKVQAIGIDEVCRQAIILRDRYDQGLRALTIDVEGLGKFERKRSVHRLRKYASRLIYLGSEDNLDEYGRLLMQFSELELHAKIFFALSNRDVGRLIEFGPSAAHAAARPLLCGGDSVTCDTGLINEAGLQAESVLRLFGLRVDVPDGVRYPDQTEMMREMSDFCMGEFDQQYQRGSGYFGKLIDLHGVNNSPRHKVVLQEAFAPDEDLITDIQYVLQDSY